ncbi:MAG TPA: phosphoribosyltransferase family protein [Oceanobacillus sp.]|nr:phosphoribosyltransferase family protein [Oceanobacillus sp.]
MTQESYAYENRTGIHPISWNDFHGICKGLAQAAAPFDPEIILAVGRGGYYPGTLISHMLRVEIYPIRISRRVNDVIKYKKPKWLVKPPKLVKGRRVLIVDEISSTGETLLKVKKRVQKMGAAEVRSAVMYAHTWGTDVPDYIGLITDELLLNPWDREIFADGKFQFHPEYAGALREQGIKPDPKLLIGMKATKVAKA